MTFAAKIHYLQRLKLYESQKPYMITFDIPEKVGKKTNHSYIPCDVHITNAQQCKEKFTLDSHGFQFEDWPTNLVSENFDDDNLVKNRYYGEVVARMEQLFPDALEIRALTYLRRKRNETFLKVASAEPKSINPIIYAHTDFTPKGAATAIEPLLRAHEYLRGHRYDMLNVWRPTRGPNRDWPLALCDFNTITRKDIEFNDVIHRDHVGESLRLYPNPEHRWYFLDDQTTSQVAIFRNVHSDGLEIPFGVHSAFTNPRVNSDQPPRESIELRCVRFFK
ncbi:hypothetical protein MGYG_07162 [Nannizzia gypsea CBS 118893]|uniref:Methyltransferase n=1 Tax=Arthroderma gypseum (strain ATCC MYA-4604 / CBS 118893) TaxID=535722 RepID=E4V290_ARTGP|nr:hypothetical protein MGYG_07162 [Nannizzia gypsea CBS 118893]EFR04155.1 hypothetical protein MGYG_07162 [Nannizzia gypsea CBS 118893]